MTYREEFESRPPGTRHSERPTSAPNEEVKIAGFPLSFVFVITVIVAGVLMIVAKVLGLI